MSQESATSGAQAQPPGPASGALNARAALVADLLTAQANHIASLKWAVGILEGKITLRNSLAEVQAEALRDPFREVMGVLVKVRNFMTESPDEATRKFSREVEDGINHVRRAVASIGDWLASSTDPTILYPREVLQRVALREVFDRAFADLGAGFDHSRLDLAVPETMMVTTAPARLAAIVAALLDNAHKHGSLSRIECACTITTQQDLRVVVGDRGPGLKGVDPEDLFRPRPQVNADVQEWAPLLGLGLFLAKMMAESLGGTIGLEDREGGGLEATVVLPQRRRRDVVLEDRG